MDEDKDYFAVIGICRVGDNVHIDFELQNVFTEAQMQEFAEGVLEAIHDAVEAAFYKKTGWLHTTDHTLN